MIYSVQYTLDVGGTERWKQVLETDDKREAMMRFVDLVLIGNKFVQVTEDHYIIAKYTTNLYKPLRNIKESGIPIQDIVEEDNYIPGMEGDY